MAIQGKQMTTSLRKPGHLETQVFYVELSDPLKSFPLTTYSKPALQHAVFIKDQGKEKQGAHT